MPHSELSAELTRIDDAFSALVRDLGEDMRAELLAAYWPTHEACLAEIAAALAEGQPYVAERAAHQLKGACGQIGAQRMTALCKGIEMALRDQRVADAFVLHGELAELAVGVESALRR
ncbi:Hpt domain-containing protein [Jeongeupia sp. USM3]|uniref:Hpt domain-containing protein n=1 Tax=Jeongeupia sp. USM3 TaxID=1906741 RepID=UPI00089DEE31|nr:Hpt domain-containing protein [Jeongeupia sp. USM3]AOX99024.1 hypothetical protein BJP62_00280 [Jeongeupia sp. USM3]